MSSYKLKLSKSVGKDVIAKIVEGENKGKYISLSKEKSDTDGLYMDSVDEFLQFIVDYKKSSGIPLTKSEIKELSYYIAQNEIPEEDKLRKIYEEFNKFIKKNNKIHLRNNLIMPLPCVEDHQVDNLFLCGKSGSGKSTFIGEYIKAFLLLFGKDTPIYLFSSKPMESEPNFLPYADNIHQIFLTIDELSDYCNDDEGISPYEHFINKGGASLVIFDDVEDLSPKIERMVKAIQSNILKTGRSSKIYTISSRHVLNSGSKTKDIWVESTKIVLFPIGIPRCHVEYGLNKYLGFNKEQISNLLSTKSRWVLINNKVPTYIIDESRCYIVDL
jgi:hypothetical protein